MTQESQLRIDQLASIFKEMRNRGIDVQEGDQPAEIYIQTLSVEEAERYAEQVFRSIVEHVATRENLEAALGAVSPPEQPLE